MPLIAFKPTKARLVIEQGARVFSSCGSSSPRARRSRSRWRQARIHVRVPAHPRAQGGARPQREQGGRVDRASCLRRATATSGAPPNFQINISMSAAKFDALLKIAISGRLPSKFFVHAGDRISARETRGMGYAIRAGVRTKFWDNKRFRTLQVTNFSVILPISVPDAPQTPAFEEDRAIAGIALEQRPGRRACRRVRGVPGRDRRTPSPRWCRSSP